MRIVRTTLGLAVMLCAFGTVAEPALAKRPRPKALFGDFIASFPNGTPISPSSPATATGTGEVERIELAEGALTIEGQKTCTKVKSAGTVESERSETFIQTLTFSKCYALSYVGLSTHALHYVKIPRFSIAMEYHANGAVEIGGSEEPGTGHLGPANIVIRTGKENCTLEVPRQSAPFKALKKPENEFEAGAYGTEPAAFHPQKIKKFPKDFQEELDVTMEFEKVVANLLPGPNCFVGAVKGNKGFIEAEIEEVKIKHGNLGFETKAEAEAEV